MELGVFFLEVPFGPSRRHVDLVNEGLVLQQTQLHLRHVDLDRGKDTVMVENWGSMIKNSEI